MKKILSVYYESTVIPSIVLGCIMNLLWFISGKDVSDKEFLFPFIFFLVLMTIEDVFRFVVKRFKGA